MRMAALEGIEDVKPQSGEACRALQPLRHLKTPGSAIFGIEREVRFFLPLDSFKSVVEGLQPRKIIQSYLPKETSELLVRELYPQGSAKGVFSYARIRQTIFPDGENLYELEFKSKKEKIDGLRISRTVSAEPFQLTEESFRWLQSQATEGTLMKERYVRRGFVFGPNGPAILNAEIDLFTAGGTPLKLFKKPFSTVDIEISRDLLSPLLQGAHTFDFLNECTNLSTVRRKLTKALSNRRLAEESLGHKQVRALARLEEGAFA